MSGSLGSRSKFCNSTVAEYAAAVVPRQEVDDPRVRRSRTAVLRAALEEFAERGYGGFTIDGVATRAGVARSTVYRIWGDRSRLIEEALEELNRQPPARERGAETPRERVEALVRHLSEAMAGSTVADCLPGLVDGAERDPDVRRLHHRYNARRRAALVEAIAEGRSSGEPGFDVDPELAALALAGAVVYRRLMTAAPAHRRRGGAAGRDGPATSPRARSSRGSTVSMTIKAVSRGVAV